MYYQLSAFIWIPKDTISQSVFLLWFFLLVFTTELVWLNQDLKPIVEASGLAYNLQPEEDVNYNPIAAGESQAVDPLPDDFEEPLLCKELLESYTSLTDGYVKGFNHVTEGSLGGGCIGLSELENLDFDTPPDLSLAVSFLKHLYVPFF